MHGNVVLTTSDATEVTLSEAAAEKFGFVRDALELSSGARRIAVPFEAHDIHRVLSMQDQLQARTDGYGSSDDTLLAQLGPIADAFQLVELTLFFDAPHLEEFLCKLLAVHLDACKTTTELRELLQVPVRPRHGPRRFTL